MPDALELLTALKKVNVIDLAKASITSNKELIADLNAGQLARGLRSDGSNILPSYSDLTIELKSRREGLAGITDHVTLFDTGAHYKGLYADIKGNEIEYGSTDEKSKKLQKKYDTSRGSIYGLNQDSLEDLEPHLRTSFFDDYEKVTGLKAN